MKRSTKVSLLVMGTVGIGGTAHAVSPRCLQQNQGTLGPDTREQACSAQVSDGGGSHYSFFSGLYGNPNATPAAYAAGTTTRGGFGGIRWMFESTGS